MGRTGSKANRRDKLMCLAGRELAKEVSTVYGAHMKAPANVTWNKVEKTAYARVTRQGETRRKYFPRNECGSRRAAMKAARKWIAKQLPSLPPPISRKRRLTKRNRSGKADVMLVSKPGRTKDQIYWYWLGYWPSNRIGVKFSVLEHGDKDAFVMACLASDLEKKDKKLVYRKFKRLSTKDRHKILAQKRQSPD